MDIKDIQLILKSRNNVDNFDQEKLLVFYEEALQFIRDYSAFRAAQTEATTARLTSSISNSIIMLCQFANWAGMDLPEEISNYWKTFVNWEEGNDSATEKLVNTSLTKAGIKSKSN